MDETTICEQLEKLHLVGKSSLCVDKSDKEYVLHLGSQSRSESNSGALLAAASSDLTVRLYSRQSLVYARKLTGHGTTITGLKFSRADPNLLYTSSFDGFIRCWDLRTKSAKAAVTFEGYAQVNNKLSSFDVSCDGKVICAGTDLVNEDAYLIFWDVRTTQKLGGYSESHEKDITQVSFHPSMPNKMISSSVDCLICLFDISQSCEDDALVSALNCESPVTQIGWCGADSDKIYSITSNNTFYLWDTITFDTILSATEFKTGKDAVGVDYLVDCFQTSPDHLYLLTGSFSGDMTVFRVTDDAIRSRFNIRKAHSDVIRCLHWDEATQSLVTGGEDSMICLWKTEPEAGSHDHKDKRKAEPVPHLKNKMRKSVSSGSRSRRSNSLT